MQWSWDELPEMSDAVLSEHLDLGRHSFLVQVSPVRRYLDYGPKVDVVHVWVLRDDDVPVALRDIHPSVSRDESYVLWSFLCDQLDAAARLVYGLRPSVDGTPNPRLGCWGARRDLNGDEADDSATALILGVAVDTTSATRTGRHELFVLAVRSAVVVALRRWVAAAHPGRALDDFDA